MSAISDSLPFERSKIMHDLRELLDFKFVFDTFWARAWLGLFPCNKNKSCISVEKRDFHGESKAES